MMSSEYVLELESVFHSGQVESGSLLERLLGTVRTGVILKDVSMEVHAGELAAVLGSKGSGKRALLEVISRRAQGPTRGQIVLSGMPVSMRLFQESCGYVTQRVDFLPELSVHQTLVHAANMTIGSAVSSYVKMARVKQTLADLALTPLSQRRVGSLDVGDLRRLAIGVQIVRDPVVLLLDEPATGLDPLHTYFVISILANHAKKYGRAVIMTLEKPRSDIFPFLDRVTYLCLGDVVYTGPTRMMIDYFRGIGFPCPELENPLMYYLCLSTVDRRSRDRFVESSNQIASLVEKFRIEGHAYRKLTTSDDPDNNMANGNDMVHKVPLTAYGRASVTAIFFALIRRSWARLWPSNWLGAKNFFLAFLLMPLLFSTLWIVYRSAFALGMNEREQLQTTFVTRNGLVLSGLLAVYLSSILTTGSLFGYERTRYYQESREGIYGGPTFVLANFCSRIPIVAFNVAIASLILFKGLQETVVCAETAAEGRRCESVSLLEPSRIRVPHWFEYSWDKDLGLFFLALMACSMLVEQQTVALMMTIRDSFTAMTTSFFITTLYLGLGSATLRSYASMPDLMLYLTYISPSRYASCVLHHVQFFNKTSLTTLQTFDNQGQLRQCTNNAFGFGCRYVNGTHYLEEKFGVDEDQLDFLMDPWLNVGIAWAFPLGLVSLNLILYLIPLPAFIKAKFRE